MNLLQVLHVSLINWAQIHLKYPWPLSKWLDFFIFPLLVTYSQSQSCWASKSILTIYRWRLLVFNGLSHCLSYWCWYLRTLCYNCKDFSDLLHLSCTLMSFSSQFVTSSAIWVPKGFSLELKGVTLILAPLACQLFPWHKKGCAQVSWC